MTLETMPSPAARTDQRELVALYQAHYGDLVRLAAMLLDDVARCEEIVQDAFVEPQTTTRPPQPGQEAAWLRSVVLNGCRSKLRHRLVRRRTALPVEAPAESAETGALTEADRRQALAATADIIQGVNVRDLRAIVDLVAGAPTLMPTGSTSAGSVDMFGAMIETVFQFPNVDELEIRFEGSCEAFGEWSQAGECPIFER